MDAGKKVAEVTVTGRGYWYNADAEDYAAGLCDLATVADNDIDCVILHYEQQQADITLSYRLQRSMKICPLADEIQRVTLEHVGMVFTAERNNIFNLKMIKK